MYTPGGYYPELIDTVADTNLIHKTSVSTNILIYSGRTKIKSASGESIVIIERTYNLKMKIGTKNII